MIKIFSWNVNGIRAVLRKGAWDEFLEQHDPDIVCLQETKATREQVQADLSQYNEYWNSSQTKKGYSGTAILSKREPLGVIYDIPEDCVAAGGLEADEYGDPNREGRVITAEFESFYLVTAYTPNAKDDLTRLGLRQKWDAATMEHCARLQRVKPVVYCGDMNVAHTEDDLANPKQNRGKHGFTDEERAGFDAWLAAGFVDTFRMFTQGNGHYTWWSHWARARERNIGWRIDYFLVSESIKDKVANAEIHASQLGSDHCPVDVTLSL